MKRVRCVILLAALSLALPLVWATPAFAQRSLTVTPNTGLVELDTVTIEGAGFNPDVSVGFCQAIDDGSPSPNDCGSSVHGIFTSPAGDFSAQLTVRRFMYVPSLGRTVDCASEACAIGAAEVNDVTRTAVFASIAFAPAPPPPATRGSITVTPDDPVDGQQVIIDGTGFRANAKIEVLQCVTDPQDPTDCSPTFTTAVADAVGAFSAPYGVQRFFSPPGGPSIDCNPPGACVMAAAEVVDIPGTIATSPFDITAQQPDGRIRRRSDGVITGDNIYNDLSLQTRRHAVAPGGKWTFAVQLENDGDLADDITVTAPPSFAPFTVRYFVSYFDITSQVTGDGFTFTSVAPGQIWTIGVQFNAAADASLGSRAESLITFTSENAPSTDAVLVGVFVRAVTTQSGSD